MPQREGKDLCLKAFHHINPYQGGIKHNRQLMKVNSRKNFRVRKALHSKDFR